MTRGRRQELTPEKSPLHFFGNEVRLARDEVGMSQGDFGTRVPCDSSTVSRIESGTLAPDRHFAEVCDETFPDHRGWFARFYVDSRDWNQPFAVPFRSFAQYEATAATLYNFEHSLLPGPLQTEDYAHAVLARHPGVTEGEVAERVSARIARQAVLSRDEPPMFWAVLDEAALTRHIGDAKIMYTALRHMIDMSMRPNIIVQVLPDTDAHVGLQGSLNIAETVGASATAHLADIADGRLIEDPATVSTLMKRFRWLQAEALPAAASRDIIEQIAEEQWNQDQ